ncbi:PLP-dependent aminotransferase family protein [Marinobacterium sp. AK62]|uniref:PLP-dependent aminotransferase family protein n=1 Tax=Marinobacterium alkalitolerans TaxID=1542925 RepID=A0ABS3Z7B0_9GAMM|nr:PLP-dependent aminotransferase family protein [Marinobacterium alkalitolerans]MBP0047592.1 PLP-dependent aminotransferase family protein [Marinobacterium alkalitolerans]
MNEHYLKIDFEPGRTLQDQIRERLVATILSGHMPVDEPMPSSRRLAQQLGVSRNTVVLIYEQLVDAGYLVPKCRRGYFIAPAFHQAEELCTELVPDDSSDAPDWSTRFRHRPSEEQAIVKPNNWRAFEFPFIYGQVQHEFFPIEQWRDCARKSMSGMSDRDWIHDSVDSDDAVLVEQIRTRLLPKRGIYAEANEILVTIGTQNSLYLLANLLLGRKTRVALENPGFRDARNIFKTFGAQLHLQPVDEEGILVDDRLNSCDYIYVTPSHQVPTGAELSTARRRALMQLASEQDCILIEDDYDADINMQLKPVPALKAHDRDKRVIYMGSLSKSISPGLRLGFMVADETLIAEARALRRLMYRHPPANNQRQAALFLAQGHYDTYLRKIRELYSSKLERMQSAIERHLPGMNTVPVSSGASSIWLEAPEGVDTEALSWAAAREGVLIEPGAVHFLNAEPPRNYFRLGFSAIAAHKIEPGIERLSRSLDRFLSA